MEKDFVINNGKLVKYIGNEKVVHIPEGILMIGECCFENCKLDAVYCPETLTRICYQAFSNCTIKNIYLNSSIKNVESNAFMNCSGLSSIDIPFDVVVYPPMFAKCKNLKTVNILKEYDEDLLIGILGFDNEKLKKVTGPNIITEDGVVYNKDKTHLISYLESKTDKYFKIPDSVELLKSCAFSKNYNLEILELGKNVEEIENDCIDLDNLQKIIFNKNLKKLNNASIIDYNQKIIDLSKTKIEKFNENELHSEFCEEVILPETIKIIYTDDENDYKITIKKDINNIYYDGDKDRIKIFKTPTLEELIEEGKTFYEASQIIKDYER